MSPGYFGDGIGYEKRIQTVSDLNKLPKVYSEAIHPYHRFGLSYGEF
jgi:hypothetical protein